MVYYIKFTGGSILSTCQICGSEFTKKVHNQKYCSHDCINKAKRPRKSKLRPEKVSGIITNEEQKKIDQSIFEKTAVKFEPPKIYRPGDKDFATIAKSVTPINKIPKERFHFHKFERNF